MTITVAGQEFVLERLEEEDGLGYSFHWKTVIPAPNLTNWGRGKEKLGDKPLPVRFIGDSEEPPSASQQQAFEWLSSHLDETVPRIQTACETSWTECYYWDGNEMSDDDEYFIEGIRIPPNTESEWAMNPRDPSLSSWVIVDMEQDWELEHGFYVLLDPVNAKQDTWTTWDGLSEMGLVKEEDDDDF